LKTRLGIQHPRDWLQVSTKVIVEEGGSFLYRYYGGSLLKGTKSKIAYNWTSN
jgi:hypothetical protein